MRKALNIFIISLTFIFCLFLFGCDDDKTKLELLTDKGYVITVRYEANGGKYSNRNGVTVVDKINPNKYTKDENGDVHIKLIDPQSEARKQSGADQMYLTNTNNFFIGWYTNRQIRKNSDGKVIDKDNNPVVLIDGVYYLESDREKESDASYDYSGHWDFETDTLTYNDDMGEYTFTLYAVYSTFFKFEYYHLDATNKWVKFPDSNNTTFDYMIVNSLNSTSSDKDTIWVPKWDEKQVSMIYNHPYANSGSGNYKFPYYEGYTFSGAYLDEECTLKIEDSYVHPGSIDFETGKPINDVCKIYVKYDKGEIHHIYTAQDLIDNASLNGIYYIENDLDFTGLDWPKMFVNGEFNGKFISSEEHKLSNITINKYNTILDKNSNVGLFGTVTKECQFSNVYFENVTFDILQISCGGNLNVGLFSGNINKDSNFVNVSLSGIMKINSIYLSRQNTTLNVNLAYIGDKNKVNIVGKIGLVIYGTDTRLNENKYYYGINPTTVTIDENNKVTFTSSLSKLKLEEEFVIIQ